MNWGWGEYCNGWFFNNGSDTYIPRDGVRREFAIEDMLSIGKI